MRKGQVHVHGHFLRREPAQLNQIICGRLGAADRLRQVIQIECEVALSVCVNLDADQLDQADCEAGLFPDLADGRIRGELPRVEEAAGDVPVIAFGFHRAASQQHAPVAYDQRACTWFRVAVVHRATNAAFLRQQVFWLGYVRQLCAAIRAEPENVHAFCSTAYASRIDDPFNLHRFVAAQDAGGTYNSAISELRRGRKTSHWMWFVFPQMAGLGSSEMSRRYAIHSLEEARAYVRHPILGPRLIDCATVVAQSPAQSAQEIFGGIDSQKLQSSMTLFLCAEPQYEIFQQVLDRYFGGRRDPQTDAARL